MDRSSTDFWTVSGTGTDHQAYNPARYINDDDKEDDDNNGAAENTGLL